MGGDVLTLKYGSRRIAFLLSYSVSNGGLKIYPSGFQTSRILLFNVIGKDGSVFYLHFLKVLSSVFKLDGASPSSLHVERDLFYLI